MRTAEEILEEKLTECDSGFERGVYIDGHGNYNFVIEAMKEYAKSVAQQALENASESAGLIWNLAIGPYGGEVMLPEIDKSSITNHDNIPTI